MERFKSIKIILFLAVVLITSAALAKSASVLLQEGLYAEEVDGDLDAAIKIYAQVIKDGSAQRSHIAQAMYRQGMCYLKKQQEQQAKLVFDELVADYSDQTKIISKVKPLLQELSNADPAALMPPETLAYVEIGSPGKQIETILNMLEGTPLANPLAAIGAAPQGRPPVANVVAGFLNPNMMAEFKKIRGMGVGITGLVHNNQPAAIVVLFPGKSDALRRLVLGALVLWGKPIEAIEDMQCVEFPEGGGAAYDDTVVILATPAAYSAGQLTWSVKQYKGVAHKPTFVSSNKSFAKVNKKDRQENALTIWANVDQVYSALKEMFPEGQMPEQMRAADGFADFKNIDDLIASLSIEEDGITVEANVGFKDGHRSVAYDLFHTPKLSKAAFEAVPSEAIALVSVALGDVESAQAQMVGGKIKEMTGLEIGGNVFANIDQITLFALPPGRGSNEALPGMPPIVTSLGLVITSDNPQQTRQILTGLLTAANLMASQSADEQNTGRYQIELVNKLKLHCYLDQASKVTVLSLSPDVLDISASAIKNSKSVANAGPLNNAVGKLSPTTSKLALVNVGGAIRAGGAHFLLGMTDSENNMDELLAQLAQSCDKTTFQFRTYEEANNFNVRAEVSELPPVSQVLGPITQLSKLALARARERTIRIKIPASIRQTTRPPVIDGQAEDLWSEAREYKIGNVIYLPPSNDEDFSASYKAMWDEKNLYVLVDVADDTLKNDSDEFWLDDGVEVFIDADNSKSDSYGGNDYQYFFEWAEANPGLGESKQGRTSGVEFATVRTDKGYRMEIKFPWSTLGVEPSAGKKVGLDVHVNDDDDGGDRDTKITWRGKEDNAWQTTEVLGTAELAGLVGWWKLDEGSGSTVADSSGSSADGTIYNTAAGLGTDGSVWYTDPERGMVLSFNGDDNTGAYVGARTIPTMTFSNGFTWAFWAKQDGNAIDQRFDVIVGNRSGGSDTQQFIKFTPTRFEYVNHRVRNDIDYDDIPEGIWMHHVLVKDGTNLTYYRDGVESGTSTVTTTIEANPFYFGGDVVNAGSVFAGERWRGYVDDVRIYNQAISEGEIIALYNEGK